MSDVSEPENAKLVTNQQLQEAVAKLATKHDLAAVDAKFDALDAKVDALDAKFEAHFGALHARVQSLEEVMKLVLLKLVEMPAEFARHAAAITEDFRRQITVVDDRYRDLPGRVTALEQAK